MVNLQSLSEIGLKHGTYVLFGGCVLAARGIRPSDDIDVLVTQIMRDELLTKYSAYLHSGSFDILKIGSIDITKDMNYIADAEERAYFNEHRDAIITTADMINGYPYMNLYDSKRLKKALGREKDLRDIILIEQYERGELLS